MNREGFEVIANSAAFRSLTLTHARDRQDRFCSVWMKQNSAQGNTLTTTAYLCLGKQKTSVSRPRLTTCILFRAQPLSLTAPSLRIFYRTSDTTLPYNLTPTLIQQYETQRDYSRIPNPRDLYLRPRGRKLRTVNGRRQICLRSSHLVFTGYLIISKAATHHSTALLLRI